MEQQQSKIEEKMAVDSPEERPVPEEKEKKPVTPKELINLFKFYFLPVLSLISFFIIILIGLYPSFKNIFDTLTEVESLKTESESLDKRIDTLKSLRSNQQRSIAYINLIESLVPSRATEVVNFQQKIKNLALSKGLSVNEPTTGETIITPTEGSLGIVEIPSKFLVIGRLENIKIFLTDLDSGEDFLIIKDMKLTRIGSQDDWNLEITFIKYQFQEDIDPTLFENVPESSDPDREVLEFIRKRYGGRNQALEF